MLLLLTEREQLRQQLESLRVEYTRLRDEHTTLLKEHELLRKSSLGRALETSRRVPSITDALPLFERHMATTTTNQKTRLHMALAKRFIKTLPREIKTVFDATAEHLNHFLDEQTSSYSTTKPLARRRNLCIRLSRLINWSAKTYDYASLMHAVTGVSRNRLRREHGEIHWHDLNEIEAAIERIRTLHPQFSNDERWVLYWQTLVATLTFAGLQLSELCWMRVIDVELEAKRGRLWIGPVTDPTDSRSVHTLKTGNRELHIDVHPRFLLPRLQSFRTQD